MCDAGVLQVFLRDTEAWNHLRKVLAIITEKVGMIQESYINVPQFHQLERTRLRRMKISVSVVMISRLYNRGVIVVTVIALS